MNETATSNMETTDTTDTWAELAARHADNEARRNCPLTFRTSDLTAARQAHASNPTPATMAAVHSAELADALQRVGR